MIKGHKIRLFPTKEQETLFYRYAGASRWIYNYFLQLQDERYKNGEKHLTAFDMDMLISKMRKDPETSWLSEIESHSLRRSAKDLSDAYAEFFKKDTRHPKFKSKKKSKLSFPVRDDDGRVWLDGKTVHIPGMTNIKYKTKDNLPIGKVKKFTNPRISLVRNKWILSFGLDCGETQAIELTDKKIGIDLGIKELAVVAFDNDILIFHNINHSAKVKKIKDKIKKTQRILSRKYRMNDYQKTKNIHKVEKQLRKYYAKLSNIRHDYIHKCTHKIISLRPYRVTMEDLNVMGLMKNRHLSSKIFEQCWGEFIRQMKYKCEWNGIEFVQADRYYPSSKTCHQCGCIKNGLKLKDRIYICSECGYVVDRDANAALNLMEYLA